MLTVVCHPSGTHLPIHLARSVMELMVESHVTATTELEKILPFSSLSEQRHTGSVLLGQESFLSEDEMIQSIKKASITTCKPLVTSMATTDRVRKFVDDLLAADIIPVVTLYHWDLPDNLNTKYGGLLNKGQYQLISLIFANTGQRNLSPTSFVMPRSSSMLSKIKSLTGSHSMNHSVRPV